MIFLRHCDAASYLHHCRRIPILLKIPNESAYFTRAQSTEFAFEGMSTISAGVRKPGNSAAPYIGLVPGRPGTRVSDAYDPETFPRGEAAPDRWCSFPIRAAGSGSRRLSSDRSGPSRPKPIFGMIESVFL
jgi:hypothetical protein